MADQISEKNTKSQILQAYNEAIAKLKEMEKGDRKAEKKAEEETKIVKQASENSVEKIVNSISRAKIDIMNTLDIVSDKLTSEFKKLENLHKAIELESKYLDEIYDIKANADSLSALLLAQKERKATFEAEIENKRTSFEEEMQQKKATWKLEQEQFENQKKEGDNQLKKYRQREEEDYNYNLQLKRKKDADAYAEQKAKLEKELSAREAAITSNEKEFAELKAKVEQFPKELENVVKETEKSTIEKLEFKYKHQSELAQKEIDGEKNLHKLLVQSLENKVKEQAEQIKQLTQKANEAGQQVQNIAVKAIEGASAQRMFTSNYEKHSEQQSKGKD